MKRRRQEGVVALEMAIVTPLLLLIGLGMIQFSWLLANYMMVTNAASTGAQYFASQRGTTTPYSSTQTQVSSSASYLNMSRLTVATTVNGTACTSDSGCATALSAATSASSPVAATVSVTYTFKPLVGGNIFGLAAMMPATLNSTVAERVQ
jgi:Flp pilus assembly protein TadG